MFKYQYYKKKAGLLAAVLVVAAALSGCAGGDVQDNNKVVVEQEGAAVEYKLAAVTRGDVISSKGVRCTYSQINSEKIAFEVSGKMVAKVYVKKGDTVKKGELLAELSGGSREDEIERLEYQIARNKLLLEQLDESESYEISRRWLEAMYNGKSWETDGIEGLQKNNQYSREDYQDAISLDQQQLAKVKNEVRQSKIYAGMDGSVSFIKNNLEGSTTVRDEVVFELMNSADCVFVVPNTTYASYIKEGQQLELSVMAGSGAGNYIVEPTQMDKWDEEMYFTVVDGGENAVLEAGNNGTLNVVLDSRKQVLTLPMEAVHKADEKWYVYIVSSEGMREVKWIEVGLQGANNVEIINGLAEGEKVVLK